MLDFDSSRTAVPPKDAASVVLLRDRDGGGFEVFFVKRSAGSKFMGGAYVFPGGKVDATDRDTSGVRTRGRTVDEAAKALGEPDNAEAAVGFFFAALRETFEEAGVLLADGVDAEALPDLRKKLLAGATFKSVLHEANATLCLDALVPLSRWVTPTAESRRFDARFFMARAPNDQVATHDDYETTESAWLTPNEALRRAERLEISLPPPTLRTLELIADLNSVDEALATCSVAGVPYVCPIFKDDNGTPTLLLPGDAEHPQRQPAIGGATRFVMEPSGRWISR